MIVHAGCLQSDLSHDNGGQFKAMPEKDHGMQHEANRRRQGGIGKSIGEGKDIKMPESKQQEHNLGEELETGVRPNGNDIKDFDKPYQGQNTKRQQFVSPIKFNQKENHTHHNGNKDEIVHQMSCDKGHDGPTIADMSL